MKCRRTTYVQEIKKWRLQPPPLIFTSVKWSQTDWNMWRSHVYSCLSNLYSYRKKTDQGDGWVILKYMQLKPRLEQENEKVNALNKDDTAERYHIYTHTAYCTHWGEGGNKQLCITETCQPARILRTMHTIWGRSTLVWKITLTYASSWLAQFGFWLELSRPPPVVIAQTEGDTQTRHRLYSWSICFRTFSHHQRW